mgnify:CR=1 FL=1
MNGELLNYFLKFATSTRLVDGIGFPRSLRTLYYTMFGVEAKIPSLETMLSLDDTSLQAIGITEQVCPILRVAVHKSLIYGSMRYTPELLVLAKRVCGYDDLLKFYEEIYMKLSKYVRNRDTKSYSSTLANISNNIGHDRPEDFYKILATLGDLLTFAKVRNWRVYGDISISTAIENDLFFVSSHFDFDDKLAQCNKRSIFDIFKKKLCVIPIPILL